MTVYSKTEITGIKELDIFLNSLVKNVPVAIQRGAETTINKGKEQVTQILKPFQSKSGGDSIINTIKYVTDGKNRSVLTIDSPYADALDKGKPGLAPDIARLPLVETKWGLRYMWTGEEAARWKKKKLGKEGDTVFVGKSGGRKTPDGMPYPDGLHFTDILATNMSNHIVNMVSKDSKRIVTSKRRKK